ncbi:MAG: hypothetical protein HGB01_06800 [Chlorobiaceae bacterium]|nr:hypothetical protein [Chlorobiaceae bacterium]
MKLSQIGFRKFKRLHNSMIFVLKKTSKNNGIRSLWLKKGSRLEELDSRIPRNLLGVVNESIKKKES